MTKLKKFLTPSVTLLLFVLSVILLLTSTIGGSRAALTYFSETYASQVSMQDIGVTLNENGVGVSWRNYINNGRGDWNETTGVLLGEAWQEENLKGEELKLGVPYREEISVTNSGTINQYVRVSLYKYWLDETGRKDTSLSPALIDLHLDESTVGPGLPWTVDEAASTPERTVLYYNSVLASGATSPNITDTLTINGDLGLKVREEPAGENVIKIVYEYDGYQFVIEATVDAVQDHNHEAAMRSAWGVSPGGGVG